MKVLVTGAGGFIGSHLAEHLLHAGHEVRGLDNFSSGRRSNLAELGGEVDIVEGDVQSYERAHAACRGCELVFHQAALPSVPRSVQDPLTSNGCNVVGTLNILLAARDDGVRRVVFASSSSVYGSNPRLPKHEDMTPEPLSPYAVGKLAAEQYCRSFHEVYGLETVALRYFNVFGPRQDPRSQYSAVVPRFIGAFAQGRPPTIYGDGEQSRDFTYVEDIVRANVLAAETEGIAGRRFNVARGEQTTVNRLVAELQELMGADVAPQHEPARPGEVRHSVADVAAAGAELGFQPAVPLREGLALTVEHFRELAPDPAWSQA